jgi:hypothetical protein
VFIFSNTICLFVKVSNNYIFLRVKYSIRSASGAEYISWVENWRMCVSVGNHWGLLSIPLSAKQLQTWCGGV